MSSSTLTVYPHLPPTTNILDSQQRTRLMRSTRKLGAVLGTTPYLLENEPSFAILPLGKSTSRALKRQGSIFTHHQTSSTSIASSLTSVASSHHHSPSAPTPILPLKGVHRSDSAPVNPPGLSSTRRPGLRKKAPQLCLRLNTVPVPPTDDRLALPLSPAAIPPLPPTPVTPTPPDAAEIRRKRMAKLARHLGESVPAELVFPSEPAQKPTSTCSNCSSPRRRSQSVHITPSQSASLVRQEWVGEWNRANIKVVQNELRNLKVG